MFTELRQVYSSYTNFRDHLKRTEENGFNKHYEAIQKAINQLQKVNQFTERILEYSNIASSLGDDDWPRPLISDPSSFNTKSSSQQFDMKPFAFGQGLFKFQKDPPKIETVIKDYLNPDIIGNFPGKKLKTEQTTRQKPGHLSKNFGQSNLESIKNTLKQAQDFKLFASEE